VTRLPQVSGRECVRALARIGFTLRRQEGSHLVLRRDEPVAQVVVPDHQPTAGLSASSFVTPA